MSSQYVKIKLRRSTASEWSSTNPVLSLGEPGVETNTRKIKIGDGVKTWNQLNYVAGADDHPILINTNEVIDDRIANLLVPGANITIQYDDSANLLLIGATGLQPSGNYATLVNGTIPSAQLPSYVDDVLEYNNLASFPASGESNKIYVDIDSKKIYRWSGSTYIEISPSPGSTDSITEGSVNKYYTDARASAAAPVQSVAGKTGTVTLTKSDVGLGNVDNTSDANKPISTATQSALDAKANASHNHTSNDISDATTAGKSLLTATDSASQNLLLWEFLPVLTSGSITAKKGGHYINKAQPIIPTAGGFSISDPSNPSDGDYYVVWDQGGYYYNIGGVSYGGLEYKNNIIYRIYRSGSGGLGPAGSWETQILNRSVIEQGNLASSNSNNATLLITRDNNRVYRWNGTSYTEINYALASHTHNDLYYTESETDTLLNQKAPLASPTFTGTVSGISKSMVGLGNVDNTSDADKPISSATQTALNGKAATSHTHDDRYYTESEIDTFLAAKLDISKTNLLGSRTLYVDGARTDTYTADGTILRPFKTIQAAHDFAVTAFPVPVSADWDTQQVVIRINAGQYAGNLTVTRPNTHFVGAGGAKTRDVIIRGTVTLNITANPAGPGFGDSNLVSFSNLIIVGEHGPATLFTAGGTAPYQLFFAHVHLSNSSGSAGSTAGKTFEVTNTSTEGIKVEIREMLVGQDYNSLVAMTFNNTRVADIDQLSATSLGTVVELNTTFASISNSKFETTSTSSAVAVIRAISSFSGAPATLVIGNTLISNLNTNGDGIYIGAGAVAQVGQVAFNVGTALGTGFAVNGVTGATLISGANVFGVLPVSPFLTNNKVATTITNAALSTSLTRNNVALDTRTPSSHTHGNITNAGAIGTTANLPVITGTSGVLQAGSFGTTANTFCQGNDSRLSDARTPTSHTHVKSDVGLGNVDNTSDANKPVSTATQTALDLKINSTEVDTDLAGGPGISLLYDNSNDLLSIYANNENYITGLGNKSGNLSINYDATTSSIQTLTLNGTAITFTKGTGWPTSSNVSVDTILRITVTSATSITWSIVNDWFNQPPAEALSIGTHLFLLRAIGSSIIEGHYIGNKTN